MKTIKLSNWAKMHDMSYRGAYEMFLRGNIPGAFKMQSGAIMIPCEIDLVHKQEYTAIYARVSTPKQKDDLTRQLAFIEEFCGANGWVIDKIYKEIASGLNDNRQQLNKLLLDKNVTRVVISEKDRLTRFGFNYIRKIFELNNCEIIIINQSKTDHDDLISDFVSVITSMAARVYGLRRHKSHIKEILNEIEK